MLDHVSDALADDPAEHGGGFVRDRRSVLPDDRGEAGVRQCGPGGVEFTRQAAPAIAGDGLAHLGQRPTPGFLNVRGLLGSEPWIAGGHLPHHLGLDHHHRQRVTKQVVQVASEPQPFRVHRRPGQFLAGPAQFPDGHDEPVDDGDDQTGQRRAVPGLPDISGRRVLSPGDQRARAGNYEHGD